MFDKRPLLFNEGAPKERIETERIWAPQLSWSGNRYRHRQTERKRNETNRDCHSTCNLTQMWGFSLQRSNNE